MKRSGVMSFLLYTLLLIAFPVYLLALGDGWGLIFAAAAIGGPGIVALIGWVGLRKGRLWGWPIALFADLAVFVVLIYALIDDGWHNFDWAVAGMTVLSAAILAALFIPVVRRSHCQRGGTRISLSS